ncbi:MAG: AraC family transcriptional regulator ligand-binding domain-containing protein [Pseudomonadales bacterium]|nr:AraC family transcriptional regulator ligand-binding domain-containing protein [Pseudomonadales bacterium]
MHQYITASIAELLDQKGITKSQWLGDIDLSGIDIENTPFLSAVQADQLCSVALRLYGDDDLGIKVGRKLKMVSLGMFGYALMTSSTVGDILKLLLRYNRAVLPSMDIEVQRTGAYVQLKSKGDHLPQDLSKFYTDTLYSGLFENLKVLAPHCLASAHLHLRYEEPIDNALHLSVFGEQITFNADDCAVFFEEDTLLKPIESSDPIAQDIFRRQCDRILANDIHAGLVSERVTRELLSFHSHFPTCAVVAGRLSISESTLQRRLAKEGTKFQQLLDQIRFRLALEYLQTTDLPISEIAALLDFDNPANFRKAFKRWSSTTPSKIRDNIKRD